LELKNTSRGVRHRQRCSLWGYQRAARRACAVGQIAREWRFRSRKR